jgi:hypothetical protein
MTVLCRVFADCQRQLGGHENVTPSCQNQSLVSKADIADAPRTENHSWGTGRVPYCSHFFKGLSGVPEVCL